MNKNKLVTIFFVIIVGSIIIFSILYLIIGLRIELNENQILYVFSATSQVIAGLFGLSIAGYIFLRDSLERAVYDDETLIDIIDALKSNYYNSIIFMSVLAAFSISLSLINILLYDLNLIIYQWLINVTLIIILGEVILIICFSCCIIDPNKIGKISNILKKNFEKGNISKDIGDYLEFIRDFNQIELNLKRQYEEITFSKFDKNRKINQWIFPSSKIVKILYHDGTIGYNLFEELLSIIKYRNYVIHSSEGYVDKLMCYKVHLINETLKEKLKVKNLEL